MTIMKRIAAVVVAGVLVVAILTFSLLASSRGHSTDNNGPAHIAVAANFAVTARALRDAMDLPHRSQIEFSVASTGVLDAQIRNGAPFDAFFAANDISPATLEADSFCQPNTRLTYAVGTLVLISHDPMVENPRDKLTAGFKGRLAIANPVHAPYGQAAVQTLSKLKLDQSLRTTFVYGENVGQAAQFVRTGNAELGLVAHGQVAGLNIDSFWIVPADHHDRILQQAVRLTEHPSAIEFLNFVTSDAGRNIIVQHGYRLP